MYEQKFEMMQILRIIESGPNASALEGSLFPHGGARKDVCLLKKTKYTKSIYLQSSS